MNQKYSMETGYSAAMGEIVIRDHITPEAIRSFEFDDQFGTYAHYKSLYTKRESLENIAKVMDTNVVLAIADNRRIIGFGVLAYPESGERWEKLGPEMMMEIKALEVSRNWRTAEVARQILKLLLSSPIIEDKIIYLVGYSWTWDLDGTKLSSQQYRSMLVHLYESFGFEEYQTNEPNICLKPENFFMGRIGKNVSKERVKNFKWLRFDIYPEN